MIQYPQVKTFSNSYYFLKIMYLLYNNCNNNNNNLARLRTVDLD